MPDPTNTTNTQFLRIERTEAALHLSEATKTAILQTALDCIVTIDHQGFVVDWNPAAERTFGYSPAEAVGREMCDLIIPMRFRGMHQQGLARAVATGQDVLAGRRIEISALRKNGEEFPVELSITRIGAGATPLFTGHIRDISERKNAERELRDSQQLLASITQNITEAIFRRSIGEGLIFVNDAYVRMFGYGSAAELRQVPPEKLYADPARRAEVVALLKRDGAVRNEEIEYRRKDGSSFWGITSATGIRDEAGGAIVYFDGAIHDITERKQAEQRQAAQYSIVRALADSASLAQAAPQILEAVCESLHWDIGMIWQADSSAQVLRCVDLWHRSGLQLESFNQATREAAFPRGVGLPGRIWKSAEPAWISDVTEDGNFPRATIAVECRLHGAFGFPICLGKRVLGVVEFFSREIRKPDARLLEMFSAIGSQIGQFIERKRAEHDLRSLNKDLEARVSERTTELVKANTALRESEARYRTVAEKEKELNQLKSNFVNVVSHEFRTPLGVILSSADILEHYFDRLRADQRAGHLQDIRHATRQMTGLMEEVLLLGRVDAGKMECRPEPVDLPGFCRRLVDEQCSATAGKCPVLLELKLPAGQARGDEGVMRHIFSNLLSNAVKYSPAKSQVHFSVRCESAEAVFEVRDNGIGIPAEDQKRLYEAFHRGQNVGEIPGTGLGMVIVKRCVDLHRGTIEVASATGRGTTFVVRLKLFSPGPSRSRKTKLLPGKWEQPKKRTASRPRLAAATNAAGCANVSGAAPRSHTLRAEGGSRSAGAVRLRTKPAAARKVTKPARKRA